MTTQNKMYDLIKEEYKNVPELELKKFLYIIEKTKLDPLTKQIYLVERNRKFTVQASIDGLRLIAERTKCYAPCDEVIEYFDDKSLKSVQVSIKKMTTDGTWHIVKARAFFTEYVQRAGTGKINHFWSKMPTIMLSKCAESLVLRKAFPDVLSGLYSAEEMGQADITLEKVTKTIAKEDTSSILATIKELFSQLSADEQKVKLKQLNITSLDELSPKLYGNIKSRLLAILETRKNKGVKK